MKSSCSPWRIPQAVAVASARRDALTECREIKKRAHTYRAGADGCGASAGRVATTGPQRPTTGLQRATTGGNARRRVQSSRQWVRSGRRWVQGWPWVLLGRRRRRSRDDRSHDGRRWLRSRNDGLRVVR